MGARFGCSRSGRVWSRRNATGCGGTGRSTLCGGPSLPPRGRSSSRCGRAQNRARMRPYAGGGHGSGSER